MSSQRSGSKYSRGFISQWIGGYCGRPCIGTDRLLCHICMASALTVKPDRSSRNRRDPPSIAIAMGGELHQLYKPAFQSIDGMVEWVNACVLRIAQILASCGEDQKKRVVSRMKAAIKSDLSGDLSIRRISAMVHLSPDYAGRIFREATGTALHQYIVHKRMKYALTLLRSTNKSVAEIAVEVSYENVSHFISNFRDCFGETPKKLRAARRGPPQGEA